MGSVEALASLLKNRGIPSWAVPGVNSETSGPVPDRSRPRGGGCHILINRKIPPIPPLKPCSDLFKYVSMNVTMLCAGHSERKQLTVVSAWNHYFLWISSRQLLMSLHCEIVEESKRFLFIMVYCLLLQLSQPLWPTLCSISGVAGKYQRDLLRRMK